MVGLVGAAVLFFGAAPLLRLMGVSDAVLPISTMVVRGMALAFPAQLILIAASNFLEGISHPRRVMVVNLAMLPINGLLAWIWATGQFGFPAMGAVGAGLATAVSLWLGAAGMVATVWLVPDHAAP